MLTLEFEGWFQCRLATDPDPWDERRGISGWTFVYPGESDLDRIIRFQYADAPRSHGPQVGVKVTKVTIDGGAMPGHPLAGANVNLLDSPVFEGHNGIIAESAKEPIVPFSIEMSGTGVSLRRSDPLDLSSPLELRRRQPERFEANSRTAAQATGIADYLQYRMQRKSNLEADLLSETDPLKRFALGERIDRLSQSDLTRDIATFSLGFLVAYRFTLRGNSAVEDPENKLGGSVNTSAAWPLEFWMGAWDADALCGFTRGTVRIPFTPLP
jgi:hypothetical protein